MKESFINGYELDAQRVRKLTRFANWCENIFIPH